MNLDLATNFIRELFSFCPFLCSLRLIFHFLPLTNIQNTNLRVYNWKYSIFMLIEQHFHFSMNGTHMFHEIHLYLETINHVCTWRPSGVERSSRVNLHQKIKDGNGDYQQRGEVPGEGQCLSFISPAVIKGS